MQTKKAPKLYAVVNKTKMQTIDHQLQPGKIESDAKTFLKIATKDGFIHLTDIKVQGRRRMGIKDVLNGYKKEIPSTIDRNLTTNWG